MKQPVDNIILYDDIPLKPASHLKEIVKKVDPIDDVDDYDNWCVHLVVGFMKVTRKLPRIMRWLFVASLIFSLGFALVSIFSTREPTTAGGIVWKIVGACTSPFSNTMEGFKNWFRFSSHNETLPMDKVPDHVIMEEVKKLDVDIEKLIGSSTGE